MFNIKHIVNLAYLLPLLTMINAVELAVAQNARTAEQYIQGLYTSCQGCDLSGQDLTNIKGGQHAKGQFRQASFVNANLSNGNYDKAFFTCADLSGADLSNSVLTNANFVDSNLKGADLRNADLTQADLSGALLEGANLEGANLTGAKLPDAKTIYVGQDIASVLAVRPKRSLRYSCRAEGTWMP